MKKRYYITGISGSGKSTLTKMLNERGIFAIDQDSEEYGLCSWKHNETKEDAHFEYGIGKEFLEANDWYCDIEKLKKILDEHDETVFVCGVAANQDEYLKLFDKVFLLECSPETFLKRINMRTSNDFGKHESEREHVLGWYQDLNQHLIDQGVIVVDCDRPVQAVLEDILRKIEE